MKLRKLVIISAILALLFGNIVSVAAVNKEQYGYAYVTKTGDLKTSYLTKQNDGEQASNLVGSVDGGKLASWCENYLGMKVSEKVEYASGDPQYMSYTSSGVGEVRLVISTTLFNVEKTGTFGYWSPDYITSY